MDNNGAMGFPVRLTLAFTLVALCVPSLSGMVGDFQESGMEHEIDSQIDTIMDSVTKAYYGGNGTSVRCTVTIPSGCELVIGGSGTDAYGFSIHEPDGKTRTVYAEHPSVKFHGDGLTLSGRCDLTLTAENVSNQYGIRVISL